MHPRTPAIASLLLLGSLACRERREAPAPAAVAATSADTSADTSATTWLVDLRAAGPLAYGVSLAEARRITGDSLAGAPEGAGCHYVVPRAAPAGMRFMVENGRVVRVDVDSAGVKTARGAAVGMGEAEIRRLYPESLAVQPHKYAERGHYLIVVPRAPADSPYRVIFETDSLGRVLRYRAGLRPAVEYVEGCA
jgi:hypothetical protein